MNDPTLAKMAAECPAWATATVLLRDERGVIAGYGWIERGGAVVVRAEGAKLLGGTEFPYPPEPIHAAHRASTPAAPQASPIQSSTDA